jgi:hypothetical protein
MLSLNCKYMQHVEIYLPCNCKVNYITHFGVIALFGRSLQAEHVCSLNLTFISYNFLNKGRKVLKF